MTDQSQAQSFNVTQRLAALKTCEHYSFEQWLNFLDQAALSLRWPRRISVETGPECWQPYFEDGYTPQDALIEDFSYAL